MATVLPASAAKSMRSAAWARRRCRQPLEALRHPPSAQTVLPGGQHELAGMQHRAVPVLLDVNGEQTGSRGGHARHAHAVADRHAGDVARPKASNRPSIRAGSGRACPSRRCRIWPRARSDRSGSGCRGRGRCSPFGLRSVPMRAKLRQGPSCPRAAPSMTRMLSTLARSRPKPIATPDWPPPTISTSKGFGAVGRDARLEPRHRGMIDALEVTRDLGLETGQSVMPLFMRNVRSRHHRRSQS